jgi:hypothetical protein
MGARCRSSSVQRWRAIALAASDQSGELSVRPAVLVLVDCLPRHGYHSTYAVVVRSWG